MPHTQWPTPEEVQSWLRIAGAWGDLGDDLTETLQSVIDTAVLDFQDGTGWTPFLASDTDSTRYFDAPGPRQFGMTGGGKKLFLDGGLLTLTSLAVDGNELTEGTDFYLQPYNNEVCTKVLFIANTFSKPKGIEIVGRWGYGTIIPNNVWEAVRDKAAAAMLGPLGSFRRVSAEASQAEQIKAKETGPVRTEYATADAAKTTDFASLRRMWESSFDLVVTRYLFI